MYAETQLHRGDLDLSKYRVLILSTHPEYWTRKMYERVKTWAFREGGRLMYLGGNGLNCEVEILSSGAMHFKTMRLGTGGSLGVEFLKKSLFHPLFPDLWSIRHQL